MTAWSLRGLTGAAGGFRLGPVDLQLGAAESVAVLGRSGAGKTTLLRTVAGLTPASSGEVRRGERTVTRLPPEQRSAVYVPQGLGLFPHRVVRRNVTYPLEVAGDPDPSRVAGPLMERFGLAPLADRWPTTLSSGEQQRVAIARALAARPELLLWDEPLNALDLLARAELLEGLREVRAEAMVPLLFVTHDPGLAISLADRWLVLDAGRVVYLGEPGPLFSAPPDLFLARFVGFENVVPVDALVGGSAGSLRATLRERSGVLGVGVGTPEARPPQTDRGPFEAAVDHVEPTADGYRIEGRSDGLSLRLRLRHDGGAVPRRGERVTFSLEGVRVAPIGGARAAPGGAS